MLAYRRAAWWQAALLVPLCAALYLPGLFALPPIDRDEARYAQASRQMLASGDLLVPRLQDTPRLIKPIGIYWLQALAARLLGAHRIGAYRLPSLLGATIAVLATYWIGRRWLAAPAAWLGAAWLAASSLLVVEAHLATADAALLCCIVIAQGCLAALYSAARRGRTGHPAGAAALWIAVAAGVLIKGPVAPLVVGLSAAALLLSDRRAAGALLRGLRPWWGVPLAAACLAPWLFALNARVGWRTLAAAMTSDIAPKIVGAHESHGGPPGLYLLIAPATFWPGSMVLLFALAMAWRRRRRPAERFLLAWLVPTWLFFELMPTKLPHYVLPAFPPLALLAGRAALSAVSRLRPPLDHALVRALGGGWGVLTLAIAAAPLAAAMLFGNRRLALAVAAQALVLAVLAALAVRFFWQRRLGAAACAGLVAAVVAYAPTMQYTLPRLNGLWLSRAATAAAGSDRRLAAVGYAEPSLLFEAGTHLALLSPQEAATFLAERDNALVLVAGDQLEAFFAAARARDLPISNQWATTGFNYSSGDWTDLQLLSRGRPSSGVGQRRASPAVD